MIHSAIIPDCADFVVQFPPAAERARLRARSVASPDPGLREETGAPVPAAVLFLSDGTAAAGTFSSHELPLAALDRPVSDPPENAGGEGETTLARLPGTAPGGSIASVLQKRLEHVRLGYGPEHDAALPATHLVDQAAKYAADAHDLIRRNDDPGRIRLKMVNATALLLAAIDRHDSLHPQTEAAHVPD